MSRANRRAGQNIRELALKRRIKAIACFASAGLTLFFPFWLIKTFESFLQQISSLNSAQSPTSLNMPPIFYGFFVVTSIGLVANGVLLWKRANRADQGAKGEEDTAQAILQLEEEGWKIEYGMRFSGSLGDADIVCVSPQNRIFVIDVKSHRGDITTDGTYLYKRLGKKTYPFEKDFLSQSKKQAMQVKKQKKLNHFVTPIIAFSRAKISIPSGKVQNVYVVEKCRLVSLLKSLNKN
jgi:hypothetical protein